jgi:RNA polymerase sigma-70 factor (ECF subfamily)
MCKKTQPDATGIGQIQRVVTEDAEAVRPQRPATPRLPNPTDEDAAAVQRVLAGDVDAFSGIVRRWQNRLVNLAWRFCRDRTAAEDMAQEAFVRAFRAVNSFRGDSTFSTWLTAIAINTYRSWLRARPPLPLALDVPLAASTERDALTTLQIEERAKAVRQLVLALPSRYREPIVLYYFEEMNLAATAGALRLPEGTVKARLHRGRELLKRRLTAHFARVHTALARRLPG